MAPRTFGLTGREFTPSLSARQFWLAAYDAGVTKESLSSAIASIYSVEEAGRIDLEISVTTQFSRDYPLVSELCELSGISEVELDALWLWASTI